MAELQPAVAPRDQLEAAVECPQHRRGQQTQAARRLARRHRGAVDDPGAPALDADEYVFVLNPSKIHLSPNPSFVTNQLLMAAAFNLRSHLLAGQVIPALPLALQRNRRWDEKRERALVRYYLDAGAGGLAVGVHSTQFSIRDKEIGLYA